MKDVVRVAELFAGVGGFRLGLEQAAAAGRRYAVVFSNQHEPNKRRQLASEIYTARFGSSGHSHADIATVPSSAIPDHDLLVGGFPCQDYSVASTLRSAKGLVGKKGVLWWQIHRILQEKRVKPRHLLLENVDRLLGSPAGQRGRDFAVMLRSLDELGYAVEWRVVNAADYGMPQRRKRVFLLGHLRGTTTNKELRKSSALDWLTLRSPMATALRCRADEEVPQAFNIAQDLGELSRHFGARSGRSPFRNTGVMVDGVVFTLQTEPVVEVNATLGSILQPEHEVPDQFRIAKKDLAQWRYLKGAKREQRESAVNGHRYAYAEGAMTFPDSLDRPSRTIITGEGGRAPSRFKHVVLVGGQHRRLTPVELERLNMFPDGHTEGASDAWRAFFMGNALVVGVVQRIGKALLEQIGSPTEP
ncbi:MAG: DNA (cytosine-5-)-methyltransferase [Flavobacteriales bacterium]|nr:DNA (cytosine-5-)-methyltransferase [Flavobacteriales bacterium]